MCAAPQRKRASLNVLANSYNDIKRQTPWPYRQACVAAFAFDAGVAGVGIGTLIVSREIVIARIIAWSSRSRAASPACVAEVIGLHYS